MKMGAELGYGKYPSPAEAMLSVFRHKLTKHLSMIRN